MAFFVVRHNCPPPAALELSSTCTWGLTAKYKLANQSEFEHNVIMIPKATASKFILLYYVLI